MCKKHYFTRKFCDQCQKERTHYLGVCIVCQALADKIEQIRINDSFCNLDPENDG